MKFGEQDFLELTELLAANPRWQPADFETMCTSPDDSVALRGFILRLAWCYKTAALEKCAAVLAEAQRRFPVILPVPLFNLLVDLCYLTARMADVPMLYLDYGCRACDCGWWDVGLEALGTAMVNDAHQAMQILHAPELIRRATERYEKAARLVGFHAPPEMPAAGGRRLRVGLMVSNLVDDTVAYARRVMYFARHHDPARFELRVYCTENMCFRQHQLPVMLASHPTPARAPRFLAELKRRGIPVWLAPRDKPVLPTARLVADRLAGDRLDILIMQSGPAMPIDWLAARVAPVPVKLHIHIGVCNYMPGLDATLFDNAANMEREGAGWPAYAGARILMRRGTDLEVIDQTTAAARADFNLPGEAILLGVLSNHLAGRMSADYMSVIAAVLRCHPAAWFIAGGVLEDRTGRIMEYFQQAGVADRVRFFPQQRTPAAFLKMLDVYLNEFPAGGSQSVVEAMACGRPVVAMRCGATHHESVGADIVGPPWAIPQYDVQAYTAQALRWAEDAGEREVVGRALRARAESEFSIADYVGRACDLGARLHASKALAPTEECECMPRCT